jgi:hypothetical protein
VDGRLAQVIALVGHGNAYLAGAEPDGHLEFTNSTFQYVGSLAFEPPGGAAADQAGTVREWFERARRTEMTRFWLAGAQVLLLRAGSDEAESWAPSWTRTNSVSKESKRIWGVSYTGAKYSTAGGRLVAPSLDWAADRLAQTIQQNLRVAADNSEEQWVKWFEGALGQLHDPSPVPRFHPDALPEFGYSHDARALFAAAVGAFVFGGMGSWNDVYIKDQQLEAEYRTASVALHAALDDAFQASVNSWPSPTAP